MLTILRIIVVTMLFSCCGYVTSEVEHVLITPYKTVFPSFYHQM